MVNSVEFRTARLDGNPSQLTCRQSLPGDGREEHKKGMSTCFSCYLKQLVAK